MLSLLFKETDDEILSISELRRCKKVKLAKNPAA